MVEIGKIKLQNGDEIKIERGLSYIGLNGKKLKVVLSYFIEEENKIDYIEQVFCDILSACITDIVELFKPDNPDYLDYEIIVNANDLDSLKAKINEIDNTVISKIESIINTINEAIEIFYDT